MLNAIFLPFLFWSLKMGEENVLIQYGFLKIKLPILGIKFLSFKKIIWIYILNLDYGSGQLSVIIFGRARFIKIESQFNQVASAQFIKHQPRIESAFDRLNQVFNGQHYIRRYIEEKLVSEFRTVDGFEDLQFLNQMQDSFYFSKILIDYQNKVCQIVMWMTNLNQSVNDFNQSFVAKEKKHALSFLTMLKQRAPTEEQLEAIVTFENSNLLVASAGSGKSATLVNKVCYAIEKKYALSHEVLILAYGKKAAEELVDKFKQVSILNQNFIQPNAISTFHSLGMKIIKNSKNKPNIGEWAAQSDLFFDLLNGFITELSTEPEFMWKYATLCTLFRDQNIFSKEQHHYFSEIFLENDDSWDIRQEVKKELRMLRTLGGEDVHSVEELIISNWYYMHNINYQYEKVTEYKNLHGETKVHKPDFYLTDYGIYHEHFALNKNGKAPEHFEPGYVDTVNWKRQWYCDQKVPFFETTSAQFRDGSLFEQLKNQLTAMNVSIKFVDNFDLEKIFNDGAEEALLNLIHISMKHIRNQGKTSDEISLNSRFQDQIFKIFYDVVKMFLKKYEQHMQSTRSTDFEGLLIEATQVINSGSYQHAFKFILVDEFQDISQSRLKLLQALVRQNPCTMVFAVGDDWQGIYKFSGADLDIFVHFEKYMGLTKQLYLTKTFRSNQGITTVAAQFVQKNKIQKRKKAESSILETRQVIEVVNYKNETHVENLISEIIQELVEFNHGRIVQILILGRYNRSVPRTLNRLVAQFEGQAHIEFNTFHKSKGRETDYSLLLGLNDGGLSFPSMKEDHPLLRVFVENNDNYPFAEERRLFYVALTRAKNKVFLLCEQKNRSVFIDELIQDNSTGQCIKQSYYG